MTISCGPTQNNVSKVDYSSISLGALNQYLSSFEPLKKSENWEEILSLGSSALSDPLITPKQKAKIHAQLASSSFYLGDYESCAMHANSCLAISRYLDDPSTLMRALYLLSAHKRAEGSKYVTSDPVVSSKAFEEARFLIDQALEYFDCCTDEFIKAKVLFNGGAALSDDPQGDLELASQRYQQAIVIYSSLNEYDDFARTSIRLGKVLLLQHKYEELLDLLQKIDIDVLPSKTQVHYRYLQAQYHVAVDDLDKAKIVLSVAIRDAENLKMETDLNRLRVLLHKIEQTSHE